MPYAINGGNHLRDISIFFRYSTVWYVKLDASMKAEISYLRPKKQNSIFYFSFYFLPLPILKENVLSYTAEFRLSRSNYAKEHENRTAERKTMLLVFSGYLCYEHNYINF